MVDVIFISLEPWDAMWRRNQFVAAEWARRYPDRKMVFVEPARNVSNGLRRLSLAPLRQSSLSELPGFPNIVCSRSLKLWPNTLPTGRRLNDLALRFHIRCVMKKMGIKAPLLWINAHEAGHLAGTLGERGVIYDITDDWISLDQPQRLRELVTAQDAALCRRADAVIVCSTHLQEMKRPLATNLHLIPNGVDAAHYDHVRHLNGSRPNLPEAAKQWPGPVLGYTGTIHPDRLNVPLTADLARQMENHPKLRDGSIVLIGPNLLGEKDRALLQSTGRVVFQSPIPYKELPQWMAAFDACIVPHVVSDFTESLNPIKLWEYLAAGLPIVSTPVAGFRDYPKLVNLASDAASFAAAAAGAMEEHGAADGETLAQERQAVARQHSWPARFDEIERVMASVLG